MRVEKGLPPGTRVQLKDGARHKGVVMRYMPNCSQGMLGLFPVRLDNCIWQICHANDVIVLAPPSEQVDQQGNHGAGEPRLHNHNRKRREVRRSPR